MTPVSPSPSETSLVQQLARLSPDERARALEGIDPEELLYDWNAWSRPSQRLSQHRQAVIVFSAGRGAGKTRSASEWVREKARYTNEGQLRFLLVARTSADVRDVVVEGESGVLNVCAPSEMPVYEPSKRRLTWPNGNQATVFSADEPDQLRGPNGHYAWADEMAAWRQVPDAAGLSAWDNLRIATRLGPNPQIVVTTTPKRTPQFKALLLEAREHPDRVIVINGRTSDNTANLSEAYINAIYGIYEGTRLARQELEGEMLDDVEGALWVDELISDYRVQHAPLGLPLVVVGVDPSVSERPGDEAGIVVVAATAEREVYQRNAWVLEDLSLQGSPDEWARQVARAARRWGAPVVAETNQGGALIKNALQGVDPTIRVTEVHARWGKALRAEPVVLAYEQGRVHHVNVFPELESQMTSWVPGETRDSPDRVDALVYALSALVVTPPPGLSGGNLEISRRSTNRRLPAAATRSLPASARARPRRPARVFDAVRRSALNSNTPSSSSSSSSLRNPRYR